MYQTRPDDYDAFRCIAGACPQTCCAAWEIVVDPDAQDTYLRACGIRWRKSSGA